MLFMDSFILFRIVSLYRLWFEDCCDRHLLCGLQQGKQMFKGKTAV